MIYRSEPYDPDRHDVADFRCGEPSLDAWLQNTAARADTRGTARTWVWTGDTPGRVLAYYALSAHRLAPQDVPSRLRTGTAEIPSVLIARLALDHSLRGQQLGPVLIADALERIVTATQTVGARLVVVNALSKPVATTVYKPLGFRRVPESLVLVQKIADVAAALRPPTE